MPEHADFAVTDATPLRAADVEFLLRHFPAPARRFEEVGALLDAMPATVESMLGSEYVARALLEDRRIGLEISPFLLFSVLLRRTLARPRTREQRRTVNYLANLLGLYTDARRVHRTRPDDETEYRYLYQLAAAAAQASAQDEFFLHTQLGNYALFLAGMFPDWIEHRQRHGRRPLGRAYYLRMGGAHFRRAAASRAARQYDVADVLERLGSDFAEYAQALAHMRETYLPGLAGGRAGAAIGRA